MAAPEAGDACRAGPGSGTGEPVSPGAHREPRRWLVVVLVLAVVVGGAIVARSTRSTTPNALPPAPGAIVSSTSAESSAWYCTGQSTASEQVAVGSVDLTNTSTRPVDGTITSVSDSGATVATPVSVPARSQVVVGAPTMAGSWVSQSVLMTGGGVAVTQFVHGPSGWSQAPCRSDTSRQWYFPSGTTVGSNDIYLALFNPSSTPDVVDLTFVTPSGVVHPISFQGIVLQPGQTTAENVGTYVQNEQTVATTVTTRTGRVVASETQVLAGPSSGLALVPGSPRAQRQWSIPQSQEVVGGTSSIDIFNPGPTTESVTVRTRLASGPLPAFHARVLPDATWNLITSGQTRIPKSGAGSAGNYATVVDATGGAGVVVGRAVAGPSGSPAPQAGLSNAVDAMSASSPSGLWVVPSPGTASAPAQSGAAPTALALTNPTGGTETYTVSVMTPSGTRTITRGRLPPSTFIALSGSVLSAAGLNPLLVRASGPVAISQNVGPSGAYGVVTMPGIPLDG
jgi:hypothetical protein